MLRKTEPLRRYQSTGMMGIGIILCCAAILLWTSNMQIQGAIPGFVNAAKAVVFAYGVVIGVLSRVRVRNIEDDIEQ